MSKLVGVYDAEEKVRRSIGVPTQKIAVPGTVQGTAQGAVQGPRVIIADDHPQVRGGIRRLLAKEEDIEVVGEAKDGKEALEQVRALMPDVLILDMEMPVLNGIQVARRLREEKLPVQILVLSAHADLQYILGILEYGVSGYLIKEDVPDILIEAVRGVARGDRGWISQTIADRLTLDDYPFQLTSREKEIFFLIQKGKSDHEIRSLLGLQPETYDLHLHLLCAKLRASTREDLKTKSIPDD